MPASADQRFPGTYWASPDSPIAKALDELVASDRMRICAGYLLTACGDIPTNVYVPKPFWPASVGRLIAQEMGGYSFIPYPPAY